MEHMVKECRLGDNIIRPYDYICVLKKGCCFFKDNTDLHMEDDIEKMFLKEQGLYHKNISDVNKMLNKIGCSVRIIEEYRNVFYYEIISKINEISDINDRYFYDYVPKCKYHLISMDNKNYIDVFRNGSEYYIYMENTNNISLFIDTKTYTEGLHIFDKILYNSHKNKYDIFVLNRTLIKNGFILKKIYNDEYILYDLDDYNNLFL